MEHLAARRPGASICPSEVARAVGGGAWRALMPAVREAAAELADAGVVNVTQGAEVVDIRSARGPVRLRTSHPGERPVPGAAAAGSSRRSTGTGEDEMTAAIDDVGALPGRKVHDQERQAIGKVAHVYAVDGDGEPMWIGIEASFGLFDKREIVVPLARLKEEDGDLLVPYSIDHIRRAPEIEADEIDEQADRRLRDHFGIDVADQELRDDNLSYATLVTDQEGVARRAEDPESLESPDPDKRTDETYERLKDAGPAETRDVDAGEIANELTSNAGALGRRGGRRRRRGRLPRQGRSRRGPPAEEPASGDDAKRERSGSA